MKQFFTNIPGNFHDWLSHLLGVNPSAEWPQVFMWGYVAFIGIALIVGIGGYFLPVRESLKSRILTIAWTNVLVGPFLFFFRYEGVPLLGMDAWRFVQEVGTAAWILSLIKFARIDMKHEVIAEQVASYKSKYLPKAKN